MRLFSKKTQTAKTVEAAFTKQYGLCAKSSPNVFNFLAGSLLAKDAKLKFENSGEYMNHTASLRTRLSFLDKAIRETLKRIKNPEGITVDTYIQKDTDFTTNIMSLVRKYLNYYNSEEDQYDIIVSAFTDVFLEKGKENFKLYDGTYINKENKEVDVLLEPYIHTLLARAVIKHSKKLSQDYGTRQQITPFEEETDDDALDREMQKTVKNMDREDKDIYAQLVKNLKKEFKRDRDPDRVEKVFNLLVLGYKKGEIAKEIGVSNTRVTDYVWALKEMVRDLAEGLDMEGDSDLLNELDKNFDKAKK